MRIVTANVNGIRAALRKGMQEWLNAVEADVIALQEVRAPDDIVDASFDGWHVERIACDVKGRAGVALISRTPMRDVLIDAAALGADTFLKYQDIIGDQTLLKRARHAVSENERTLLAVEALETNQLEEFGKLMNASHDSLRDDYEVTGIELDTLVKLARGVKGTLGSRMTGAGFG